VSFIVYALPRSRSFWLSKFLSYGDWYCGHDEARHARSLQDIKSWFSQPQTGTVETSAGQFWRIVPKGVKTVVLRRPIPEVVASLAKLGFDPNVQAPAIALLDRKLEQIAARVPGAISVTFEELGTLEGCKKVFEYCLPYEFDPRWWEFLKDANLQANIPALGRYIQAFRPQVEWLRTAAKNAIIAELESHRRHDMEGITFQQESWNDFFKDAQHLLEVHSTEAGSGTNFRTKNLPLYKIMCQTGMAQITTARCNGRLFGYVINGTGPSMDHPDELIAMHFTTYVSKEFPGLGRKLVRAANEVLKDRGVSEVLYRVGATQKKLDAFYKRIGAEYRGEEYALRLE
jgi:hypothetical protein